MTTVKATTVRARLASPELTLSEFLRLAVNDDRQRLKEDQKCTIRGTNLYVTENDGYYRIAPLTSILLRYFQCDFAPGVIQAYGCRRYIPATELLGRLYRTLELLPGHLTMAVQRFYRGRAVDVSQVRNVKLVDYSEDRDTFYRAVLDIANELEALDL